MEMRYWDINSRDLQGVTLADLLVNIEANFEVLDDCKVVYSERSFPVAELARELAHWIAKDESNATDFYFSSLSFEDSGVVRILRTSSGWAVGSVFTPGMQSTPISWLGLVAVVSDFVARVQRDVADLGFDPEFVMS